ncbi:unnamed protein product [Amaranthus hypochondriacus]
MSRINECVKIEWESGTCDVWVSEIGGNVSMEMNRTILNEDTDDEDGVDDQQFKGRGQGMLMVNGVNHGIDEHNGENNVVPCAEQSPLIRINTDNEGNQETPIMAALNHENIMEEIDQNTATNTCQQFGVTMNVEDSALMYAQVDGGNGPKVIDPIMTVPCSNDELNRDEERFDPVAMTDANERHPRHMDENMEHPTQGLSKDIVLTGPLKKRPKGRPKKRACSIPEPLFVPSTPISSTNEAENTWSTAKQLEVSTNYEGAVISALRKSKRLQLLERNNATSDR